MTEHKFKRGDLIGKKLKSMYSPLIILKLNYFKSFCADNRFNLIPSYILFSPKTFGIIRSGSAEIIDETYVKLQ